MSYVVIAHPVPIMGNGILLDVRYQQSATPNCGLCMTVYSSDDHVKSGDIQPAVFMTDKEAGVAVEEIGRQGYNNDGWWTVVSLGEFLFGT